MPKRFWSDLNKFPKTTVFFFLHFNHLSKYNAMLRKEEALPPNHITVNAIIMWRRELINQKMTYWEFENLVDYITVSHEPE